MEPKWWHVWGIGVIVLILCLLGGVLNGYWMIAGQGLPAYGWVFDGVLATVVVTAIVMSVRHIRRHRQVLADEFHVTKSRHATHMGVLTGLFIYSVTTLWPYVHPVSYHAFIGHLGTEDAYSIGRVAGMMPFVIGICIGQVAAWLKYR